MTVMQDAYTFQCDDSVSFALRDAHGDGDGLNTARRLALYPTVPPSDEDVEHSVRVAKNDVLVAENDARVAAQTLQDARAAVLAASEQHRSKRALVGSSTAVLFAAKGRERCMAHMTERKW